MAALGLVAVGALAADDGALRAARGEDEERGDEKMRAFHFNYSELLPCGALVIAWTEDSA